MCLKCCVRSLCWTKRHKAYGQKAENSDEFVASINRLNPSLVIELSATPSNRRSNLLVDISGVDLKAEEMIKLPVQVTSFTNAEWQHTLIQAHAELERLTAEAVSLQQNEGRYIRPIAVVRVERTGGDQRDGEADSRRGCAGIPDAEPGRCRRCRCRAVQRQPGTGRG